MTITFDQQWNQIIRDIESLGKVEAKVTTEFLEIASIGLLAILKENTPVKSGDLRDSWKVFEKTFKFIVVGTDLTEAYSRVVNGMRPQSIRAKNGKALHFFIGNQEYFRVAVETAGSRPNPFVEPLMKAMDIMLEKLILSEIKDNAKIFKDINNVEKVTKVNINNVAKTVGLTGTKRNTRRGRGTGLQRAKTGRKSFKRTLSRRRRTGKFITSKSTKVG